MPLYHYIETRCSHAAGRLEVSSILSRSIRATLKDVIKDSKQTC